MTVHTKIAPNLYLVRQTVNATVPAKPVETPVNHILVIDVSGSMWGELDAVRDHIKNKLPKLLRAKDTLSLIAFSGRGQCWTILTGEEVATLTDLSDVNAAIDKWLRPVGLTGFKEPIEAIAQLVQKVGKQNSNPFSAFFMSDGCDNQWSRKEILDAVEKSAAGLSAATVVEYGYYADRPLLTQMAERWGGSLIFSENFNKFQPTLEASVKNKVQGGKKRTVNIEGDTIGGFTFAFDSSQVVTYGLTKNAVAVPESIPFIYYLSPAPVGTKSDADTQAVYAAISLFAVRMKPDVVLPLLKHTGDVAFIDQFVNCFGKQKYSAFQAAVEAAAFNPKLRLTAGFDPNRVPPEDALTVIDLLGILQEGENKVLLDHPAFQYSRIGRTRVDANTKLTKEEEAELESLTEQLRKTKKVHDIKALNERIAALTDKPEPLKFVADPATDGYDVQNLVFNEDRPNVSILVKKTGTVDIADRLMRTAGEHTPGKLGGVPDRIRSFVYRNYTIVKDGIVNVQSLPVHLSLATAEVLDKEVEAGRLPAKAIQGHTAGGEAVFDLTALPIVNRKSVKSVSAEALFRLQWTLLKNQAAQKVFNAYIKEAFPEGKTSEGYAALYGDTWAAWLKDQGITDYGGFAPKVVQGEAQDVYTARQLVVKIKGYSTLPSLNEYRKKAASGKLNGPAKLMETFVNEVEAFKKSTAYTNAANPDEVFKTWLTGKARGATMDCRATLFQLAQTKFAVLVGNVWFKEFSTLDENQMELTIDKQKLEFSVHAEEYEEKI